MKELTPGLVAKVLQPVSPAFVAKILALPEWANGEKPSEHETVYRAGERAWCQDPEIRSAVADIMRVKTERVEPIQLTTYNVGDHFNWHMDRGEFALSQISNRLGSLTIQLTDPKEYRGGDLEFQIGGVENYRAPRYVGAAILFSAWVVHRVTKITKGQRKSLVAWVR